MAAEVSAQSNSDHGERDPINLAGDALVFENGQPILIGAECSQCGTKVFPYVAVCSHCMSADVRKIALATEGRLYSFSTIHAGPAKWHKPFTAAYVDLDDGVRIFARYVGSAPPRCDEAVRLSSAEIGVDPLGTALISYVFLPAKESLDA